jgi:hypothetical protein
VFRRLFRAIERHQVDIAGSVVCFWQLGCFREESDPFAVGADIIVSGVSKGLRNQYVNAWVEKRENIPEQVSQAW